MEKYNIEKIIGEGTYGIVYKAKLKDTNEYVAIKKFKNVEDNIVFKREIQACSMLNHQHIITYRQSFRHEGMLHLVYDYIPYSLVNLLSKHRQGLPPSIAQKIIYQLCLAIQCCHANQIIHRDVKPDNILLDKNGDMKLCDFGLARTIKYTGDPLSDYVATRWYRSPEQELRSDRYSFDSDIWSVGCILVELLTGQPIFPGKSQIEQINLIQSVLGPFPQALQKYLPRGINTSLEGLSQLTLESRLHEKLPTLPPGTLEFLRKTLHLDPKGRMSATECLAHEFLRSEHKRVLSSARGASVKSHQFKDNDDSNIEEDLPVSCSESKQTRERSSFLSESDSDTESMTIVSHGTKRRERIKAEGLNERFEGKMIHRSDKTKKIISHPIRVNPGTDSEASDVEEDILQCVNQYSGTEAKASEYRESFDRECYNIKEKNYLRANSTADNKDANQDNSPFKNQHRRVSLTHVDCYDDDFEDC